MVFVKVSFWVEIEVQRTLRDDRSCIHSIAFKSLSVSTANIEHPTKLKCLRSGLADCRGLDWMDCGHNIKSTQVTC